MITINWKGREWFNGQSWGVVNPNDLTNYCDISQVKVQNGDLHLANEYKPKFFPDINATADFAIGLLTCRDSFFYGDYHFEAKLPDGANDWPAIWLWGKKSWPPEVDILEGYSNKKGSYFRWGWPLWASETNFHYRENDIVKSTGAAKINTCFKNPKKFINYEMEWRHDYIKIYADDRCVRTLEGELMKHFREPMRLILNNSVRAVKNPTDKCNAFVVREFDYIPFR